MKATDLIKMLKDMIKLYGDQRVTLQDGVEVGQLSAHGINGKTCYTVEPFDQELWESDGDSHDGSEDSQNNNPTSSDDNPTRRRGRKRKGEGITERIKNKT